MPIKQLWNHIHEQYINLCDVKKVVVLFTFLIFYWPKKRCCISSSSKHCKTHLNAWFGKNSFHIPKYFAYKSNKWIFSIICLCSPSQKFTFIFVVYLEGILPKILLLYYFGGLKKKRHLLGCMFHYLKNLPFFSFSPHDIGQNRFYSEKSPRPWALSQ